MEIFAVIDFLFVCGTGAGARARNPTSKGMRGKGGGRKKKNNKNVPE